MIFSLVLFAIYLLIVNFFPSCFLVDSQITQIFIFYMIELFLLYSVLLL